MLVAQGCTLRSEPCAAVEAWLPSSFGCRGRQSRGSGPVFFLNEQFIYKHTQFNCLSLVLGSSLLFPALSRLKHQRALFLLHFERVAAGVLLHLPHFHPIYSFASKPHLCV